MMTRIRNGLLFGMCILLGCGAEVEEVAEVTTERQGPTEVEMVAAMEAHYSSTILAHDALIQGDLQAFRTQLAKTRAHELPPKIPEHWKPLHKPLRDAAATAADVTDLPGAGKTMADVVLACGACHQALVEGPLYPAPAPSGADTPVREGMREHQWATERLWEGVTGPWNNAWERGASALAETRVFSNLGSAAAIDEAVLEREAVLRSLGEEAMRLVAPADRAEVYGRVLVTCGGCHQAMKVEIPRN